MEIIFSQLCLQQQQPEQYYIQGTKIVKMEQSLARLYSPYYLQQKSKYRITLEVGSYDLNGVYGLGIQFGNPKQQALYQTCKWDKTGLGSIFWNYQDMTKGKGIEQKELFKKEGQAIVMEVDHNKNIVRWQIQNGRWSEEYSFSEFQDEQICFFIIMTEQRSSCKISVKLTEDI